MKSYTNTTLGFSLNISVPSDASEFDQLAGRVGACVEEANANIIYRGWNAAFREAFADALIKSTGIKRRLDEKAMAKASKRKDGSTPEIFESAGSYFEFVKATEGKETVAYQDLAIEVAKSIAFDPKPAQRTGRVSKELIAAAESIIAKGADALEKVIGRLNERNGLNLTLSDDLTIDVEELARAIGVEQARKLAEMQAELCD